jgi:hypothetical protein
MRLSADDLRAYLARDWDRLRDLKRAYWRDRLDRGGLVEAIRITELLRKPVTDKARDEDLQTHQRVAEALAKTAARTSQTRARNSRARGVRRAR